MTTKGKPKERELLVPEQFDDLLAACFPRSDEPHILRVAAKALGAQWAHEAIKRLREQIEAGSPGSPPAPLVIPPMALGNAPGDAREPRGQPPPTRSNRAK